MTYQASELSSGQPDDFVCALAAMVWVADFLSVSIATKSALIMVCAIAVPELGRFCSPRYLAQPVMEVQEF